MHTLKIGLLPLYLQFYLDVSPSCTEKAYAFAGVIEKALAKLGVGVVAAKPCTKSAEVREAVASFERERVDAVVTLHLAYSPSLVAVDALANSRLPIIMLDTTPDFDYPADHSSLMYNHGIHGVQDLANLLRRRGKTPVIVVGHWSESGVLPRTLEAARAASVVAAFRRARVGRVGGDFPGMGDFLIASDSLVNLGITVVSYNSAEHGCQPTEAEASAEAAAWGWNGTDAPEAYRASAVAALQLRHFLACEKLDSFTFNFMDAHTAGLATTPFAEACLAMQRGIGYAGEDDVLDAAWVGALLNAYPNCTFTEMFCPDWKRGRLYLSHMGEVNLAVISKPSTIVMQSGYLPTPKPVAFTGGFMPGQVTIANLAPGPDDKLELLTARGELIPVPEPEDKRISGLFRPTRSLGDFLRVYSECGGTHHSALCYDVPDSFWPDVARFLGIEHHQVC